MSAVDIVFYILSAIVLGSSLAVILCRNPLYSALSLAGSMIGVAALFFQLDAQFVAGVQLVVYAGAVMVLFVMVIMLFDLKHESGTFTSGSISGVLKVASAGAFCGLVAVCAYLSTDFAALPSGAAAPQNMPLGTWNAGEITKDVATQLFSKYLFSFEVMGVLLLAVAIGAVALSRSVGGTHARN